MASRDDLLDLIDRHPRLFVLTGAGVSTGSGIPDYRDDNGEWKRTPPVTLQAFMASHATRQRYWARSLVGWRWFGRAQPNAAHRALAALEADGRIALLLTQNVDGLHQRAGSRQVIDLHGRLDAIRCMGCGDVTPREPFQAALVARNPAFAALGAALAPDGDADLDGIDFSAFDVPACAGCGGILKPDVVFFGEHVPRDRVRAAMAALADADAVLVVGSSLMVRSGLRFVEAAAAAGKPVAAINIGRTRADDLLCVRVAEPCAPVLDALAATGSRRSPHCDPRGSPAPAASAPPTSHAR